MNRLALDQVLAAVSSIPSLPAVVMDLLASLENDDDIDIGKIQRQIALDQALSARTLRLANSSFYGMRSQVRSIADAVSILGFRNIRNIATTAALMERLNGDGTAAFGMQAFWRHAMGTALCARALARHAGLHQDYGYTTGLLHDIGRLVLATRFAGPYQAAMAHRQTQDCLVIEAEQAVLGLDHALVGSALARHWNFPESMVLAVQYHHQPLDPQAEPMAALIQGADAIAHALDFDGDPNNLVPLVPARTWQQLRMDAGNLREVVEEVDQRFEAAAQMLS